MKIKGTLNITKNVIAGTDVQTGNSGSIKLSDADSSNFINLKAPSTVSSDVTLTFPATVGSANQALTTDGTSGILSWTTISGASPAGSGSELQVRSNSTTFAALTGSASSGSNLAINTSTTSNAQLTVKSQTGLVGFRVEAGSGAADSTYLYQGVNQLGNTIFYIKNDGYLGLPYLEYVPSTRTFTLTASGGTSYRNFVAANVGGFTGNNQSEFLSQSNNIIAALNVSAGYTAGVSLGSEDNVSTNPMTGTKIFAIANQTSASGTKSTVYGLECYAGTVNTGGATTVSGAVIGARNANASSVVTTLTGLTIAAPTLTGSTTTINGINIKSQYSASGTSRAIHSEGGEVLLETGNANAVGLTIKGALSQSGTLFRIRDNSNNDLVTVGSSGYMSATFTNSGFAIRDTDNSNKLTLTTSSNLSADRSLTLAPGDASRTVTMTGDANLSGLHRVFYTQNTTLTFQGSVSSGSFIGGAQTIPANWFSTGRSIKIDVTGHLTTGSSPGTFTLKLKLGNTVMLASTGTIPTASLTDRAFTLNAIITCTDGLSGYVDGSGLFIYNNGTNTMGCIGMANQLGTIDTTISQNLNVVVEFTGSSSATRIDIYSANVCGYEYLT